MHENANISYVYVLDLDINNKTNLHFLIFFKKMDYTICRPFGLNPHFELSE